MSYSFRQLPKAQKEILSSWEYYEDQRIGLGDEFKDDLVRKIKSITDNPLHYPQKGNYREAQTDRFPFLIVFKVMPKKKLILIVSVFHTSRNPRKKYKLPTK